MFALCSMTIRLVTFDALYTLVKPRRPVHVQYAEVFEQHGLRRVDPDEVKRSFKQGEVMVSCKDGS
jgi:phosphoglycolate phosphatase-like HAD superfamily hydrolase